MNGKNSMVPTLSQVSVSTCAAVPMMRPRNHSRLRNFHSTKNATRMPNSNEWVKPTPGKPR